jgi:predicted NBD/HSP70 family sugar kinase
MIAAFDIGGTQIKFALIDQSGNLFSRNMLPTYAELGGLAIINQIINLIQQFQKDYTISGIAISSAGVIDPYKGVVLSATDTLKMYAGTPIKSLIESTTNIFTTVENDVNCAALAESKFSNPPLKDFIEMTIGTGIGGAIVINGNVFHGSSFSAGEWGRLIIDGIPYEKQASVSSLIESAKQKGLNVNEGLDIFNMYDEKDILATEVVNHFYERLSAGIVNLVYALNPKTIVIGGGISHRGERFINELRNALGKQLDPFFMQSLDLRLATMRNDSGIIGAYLHHLNQTKK